MGPPHRFSGTDRTEEEADNRAFRLWVPFEVGDHTGFFHTHEDRTGRTLDFEGRLDYRDGRSVELTGVTHKLTYQPGTIRPSGGTFDLVGADGQTRHYQLRPADAPTEVHGFGYCSGWHDGRSAGMYRGPLTVEHDTYSSVAGTETSGPPHVRPERRLGPTEYPCHLLGPDGGEGMAHLEHHVFGPFEPYGFP